MFGLFSRQDLIDDASRRWLVDVYAWALRNFGSDVFHDETILVLPTDAHFPGRAASAHGMAELIFNQVKGHAGLAHWPTRLVPPQDYDPDAPQRLELAGAIRGARGGSAGTVDPAHCLTLSYHPAMVSDPEALIATYAQTLAGCLASLGRADPPGGPENWLRATEVLAVFMGFGVMIANTAYAAPKTGCGSCRVPGAERTSYLSQYDLTYALAMFGVLKGIAPGAMVRHLKSPLRGHFKRASKELRRDASILDALKTINVPLPALGHPVT